MNETSPTKYTYDINVVSVYDADTITADIDLGFKVWWHGQRLRLYGVNAPEVRGPERVEGLVARDKVREWLRDADRVWINSVSDKAGKFGRPLAILCIEGWERSVNHHLLKDGLATFASYSKKQSVIDEARRLLE